MDLVISTANDVDRIAGTGDVQVHPVRCYPKATILADDVKIISSQYSNYSSIQLVPVAYLYAGDFHIAMTNESLRHTAIISAVIDGDTTYHPIGTVSPNSTSTLTLNTPTYSWFSFGKTIKIYWDADIASENPTLIGTVSTTQNAKDNTVTMSCKPGTTLSISFFNQSPSEATVLSLSNSRDGGVQLIDSTSFGANNGCVLDSNLYTWYTAQEDLTLYVIISDQLTYTWTIYASANVNGGNVTGTFEDTDMVTNA